MAASSRLVLLLGTVVALVPGACAEAVVTLTQQNFEQRTSKDRWLIK